MRWVDLQMDFFETIFLVQDPGVIDWLWRVCVYVFFYIIEVI